MQCLIHFLTFRHAGCVITEMKNKIEKLTKETLGKPLYLWSGPSLSSVAFLLFLRNNSGGDEASETVNLKNETQLLPKTWNKIKFSTTKVAIRSWFRNWLREYSQSMSLYQNLTSSYFFLRQMTRTFQLCSSRLSMRLTSYGTAQIVHWRNYKFK